MDTVVDIFRAALNAKVHLSGLIRVVDRNFPPKNVALDS